MRTHLGAATGTKTSAFALQAQVSVARSENVSRYAATPPQRDDPISGYQTRTERYGGEEDNKSPAKEDWALKRAPRNERTPFI